MSLFRWCGEGEREFKLSPDLNHPQSTYRALEDPVCVYVCVCLCLCVCDLMETLTAVF